MKTKLLIVLLASALVTSVQAHLHYGAGIIDQNGNGQADAGEQLAITNFPNSGLIVHMQLKAEGLRYGGYYTLDEASAEYFTFTALSNGDWEAAAPNHASTGAYLWMEITSVIGPDEGEFGYWEGSVYEVGASNPNLPWSYNHTTPTVSFAANEPTAGYRFVLSEPDPAPGPDQDPFGHIHSRGFTATVPGTYTVGFAVYDLSTSGPGGGSIHTPSQTYYVTFIAVPEPSTMALGFVALALGGGYVLRGRRMQS